MHKKLFTIAKNTFTETLRQPVYAVIIVAALLLFFISPSLTMYSFSDDNKLLREIGLSTLFLTSLFIAIFSASGAIAEELEKKTITTVLTKPVQRPIFIIAKFFGVAAAVILAHYICTIALLMAIRHGVLETVNDTHDWTVIGTAGVVALATFLLSAFFFRLLIVEGFSKNSLFLYSLIIPSFSTCLLKRFRAFSKGSSSVTTTYAISITSFSIKSLVLKNL